MIIVFNLLRVDQNDNILEKDRVIKRVLDYKKDASEENSVCYKEGYKGNDNYFFSLPLCLCYVCLIDLGNGYVFFEIILGNGLSF